MENNNQFVDVTAGFSSGIVEEFRNMDIFDLLVVSCLSQSHNLASVAEILQMSQSAVSQRIRKMQGNSESNIFKKNGRSLTLTEEGHRLAQRVTPALDCLRKKSSGLRAAG
jgi:DNA-binding transcriptional LysR family regulator